MKLSEAIAKGIVYRNVKVRNMYFEISYLDICHSVDRGGDTLFAAYEGYFGQVPEDTLKEWSWPANDNSLYCKIAGVIRRKLRDTFPELLNKTIKVATTNDNHLTMQLESFIQYMNDVKDLSRETIVKILTKLGY